MNKLQKEKHLDITSETAQKTVAVFRKNNIFSSSFRFLPPQYFSFFICCFVGFFKGSDLWPLGVVEEKVSCSLSLPSPPVDHNGRMGRGNSFSPPPLITPSYCSFFLSVFSNISLACQRAPSSSLRSFLSLHKTIWFIHDPPSWSSLPLFCHSVIWHLFCLL